MYASQHPLKHYLKTNLTGYIRPLADLALGGGRPSSKPRTPERREAGVHLPAAEQHRGMGLFFVVTASAALSL